MQLVLVRHGETTHNATRRIQGWTDIPLNETGRSQARQLAAHLANKHFDAVYASPLQRAWETAQIITAGNHPAPRREDRLKETHYGIWENLSWEEVRERYPETITAWQTDRNHTPSEAEPLSAFNARVADLWHTMQRDHTGQRVLLVGHGGSLRTLICVALGIDPALRWNMAMKNTSVSELALDDTGPVLVRLNSTCHLQ